MPRTEYEAAMADFFRRNSVTRCPTACVAPTRTAVTDADRDALRNYSAAREAARIEKLHHHHQWAAS
jgi:hypothetical protein